MTGISAVQRSHKDALPDGFRLLWYEVRSILGRGGFGITYLAEDRNLHKKVAIKEYLPLDFASRDSDDLTVRPNSDQSDELYQWGLSRFREEAQTLARFSHPNIVRVLTVFDKHNTAYMAMEYEQGENLEALMKSEKQFTEEELLNIFVPILEGLGEVHKTGFIHRDIKPSNILMRPDGTAVLLDFGSARKTVDTETQTWTTLVTHGYAPFEQYDQETNSQGQWTDIYSMGATLYRLATGRKPADAMARGVACTNHDPDPYIPAVKAASGKYSNAFLTAIDHSLEFKAQDRPQSADEWIGLLTGNSTKRARKQSQTLTKNLGGTAEGAAINGKEIESEAPTGLFTSQLSREKRSNKKLVLFAGALMAGALSLLFLVPDSPDYLEETEMVPTVSSKLPNPKVDAAKAVISESPVSADSVPVADVQPTAEELAEKARREKINKLLREISAAMENGRLLSSDDANGEQGQQSAIHLLNQAYELDAENAQVNAKQALLAEQLQRNLKAKVESEDFAAVSQELNELSALSFLDFSSLIANVNVLVDNKKAALIKEQERIATQKAAEEAEKRRQAQLKKQQEEARRRLELERKKVLAEQKKLRTVSANNTTERIRLAIQGKNIAALKAMSSNNFRYEPLFNGLFKAYKEIKVEVTSPVVNGSADQATAIIEFKELINQQGLPAIPASSWQLISINLKYIENGWIVYWE